MVNIFASMISSHWFGIPWCLLLFHKEFLTVFPMDRSKGNSFRPMASRCRFLVLGTMNSTDVGWYLLFSSTTIECEPFAVLPLLFKTFEEASPFGLAQSSVGNHFISYSMDEENHQDTSSIAFAVCTRRFWMMPSVFTRKVTDSRFRVIPYWRKNWVTSSHFTA